MTFELRIVLVSLAAFAGVGLVATALVPLLAGRRATGTAAQRAQRLADLRLLPASAGAAGSAIAFAAFLIFESRWDSEEVALAVQVLAAFGALLLLSSAWRGFKLFGATRSAIDAWFLSAERVELPGISVPAFVVDTTFPVVTVVGLRHPRLLIARSVLGTCSEAELRAILAHEQGHIDRHDNLRRLLISIAPDVLSWLPASARMLATWREAAEDAADDDAAKCGEDGKVRLAEALLKVARLAPSPCAPPAMPASALYRGESLDRRVRRLLADRDNTAPPAPRAWMMKAAFGIFAGASLTMLESVHGLLEGLIHTLP